MFLATGEAFECQTQVVLARGVHLLVLMDIQAQSQVSALARVVIVSSNIFISFIVSTKSMKATDLNTAVANAELQKILEYTDKGEKGFEAKKWYDAETDSDIMTWLAH